MFVEDFENKIENNNTLLNNEVLLHKENINNNITQFKEIYVPNIGDDELEITEILVKIGDSVTTEQSLITVENEKSSIEIPSPCSGIVHSIKVCIGDKIKTNSCIMLFNINNIINKNQQNQIKLEKSPQLNNKQFNHNNISYASPAIRKLARKFDINLNLISGTGRKNRILHEDIYKYIKSNKNTYEYKKEFFLNNLAKDLLPLPKINFNIFGDTEKIKINKIRKLSSNNLHRNWLTIPHVTQFDQVDITELDIFRKQQNIEIKKDKLNLKITILIFIIKSVAKILQELPYFNSSLSEDKKNIILKKYINIGIAVNTKNGLLVPVLKDVQTKNIIKLTYELNDLINKAHSGKLKPSDMQGGCFTISNLGNIGGMEFTPIINAPEVAILGISQAVIKPIWNNTKFIPRLMLPLSLSYDHRVINGVDGAYFLVFIKKFLSDIRCLLM